SISPPIGSSLDIINSLHHTYRVLIDVIPPSVSTTDVITQTSPVLHLS
ncbi:18041_t:CDS:1, partial [Gigaspora rosea]